MIIKSEWSYLEAIYSLRNERETIPPYTDGPWADIWPVADIFSPRENCWAYAEAWGYIPSETLCHGRQRVQRTAHIYTIWLPICHSNTRLGYEINSKFRYYPLLDMTFQVMWKFMPISTQILSINIQRLRWFGEVDRMEENAPAERVFNAGICWSRRRRRPCIHWKDQIKEVLS